MQNSMRCKTSTHFFDKVDGYIRKYLTFVHSEKLKKKFNRIRYLITLKSNISSICSHNRKIKIDSDDDLSLEKKLNMQNVVILIKSVFLKKIIIIISIEWFSENLHMNNT